MEYTSIIGGQSGENALATLLDARGPLADVTAVPETLIEEHVGKVPNLLIDLWRFYGVGALEGGTFWFPMPGLMDPVTDLLFQRDSDFKGDTYAVAYGAMGNLLCWNTRYGIVTLTSKNGFAQAPGLFASSKQKSDDEALLEFLTKVDPFFFDAVDEGNQPMLAKAQETLRPLEAGEVFAVLPIRNSAGPTTLDRVEILPVADHWTDIATNQVFILHDIENQRYNIREIAGAAD